jgi:sugar/nucleoside kinase (ribokinase family)
MLSVSSLNKVNQQALVIVGTGLVALDVVISDGLTHDPLLCAGGTCGNVLIALAYLGWESYPVARLRSDAASKRVTDDLKTWGVKLDFVSSDESGSTPIVVQHIRHSDDGRTHSFSRKCPACGAWLPWYKAVRASTVPALSARLPKAHVFYFDRTSRGAITLAEHYRKSGAIVVFEPSSESEPHLLEKALSLAHVVKVASNRLPGNEALLKAKKPLLTIETCGAHGLRFSKFPLKGKRSWQRLSPFPVENMVDSSGAGDWCTAGIISSVGRLGPEGLAEMESENLLSALQRGQAMAAWACGFEGARGGMYRSTKTSFSSAVKAYIDGKSRPLEPLPTQVPRTSKAVPVWCDRCLPKA